MSQESPIPLAQFIGNRYEFPKLEKSIKEAEQLVGLFVEATTDAFYGLMQFLSDEDIFQSKTINDLVSLLQSMVEVDRVIPQVVAGIDPDVGLLINFNHVHSGVLQIPAHFISRIYDNPLNGLYDVVSVASQSKDILVGRPIKEGMAYTPQTRTRIGVYTAEMLYTLSEMTKEQEIEFVIPDHLREYIDRYPSGVGSAVAVDDRWISELVTFPYSHYVQSNNEEKDH